MVRIRCLGPPRPVRRFILRAPHGSSSLATLGWLTKARRGNLVYHLFTDSLPRRRKRGAQERDGSLSPGQGLLAAQDLGDVQR